MNRTTGRGVIVAGVGIVIVMVGVAGYAVKSMGSEDDLRAVGQNAPDFAATTPDGKTVHLSDSLNKSAVILVFYPGDNTPVCTAQLCALRDNWTQIQDAGATVYGVNPADATSHTNFSQAHHFPFPLLVDTGNKIAQLYGCDSSLGLTKRTVYVIGKDGRVKWGQRGNPSPSEILAALK